MASPTHEVEFQITGSVATIVINRPEHGNTLSQSVRDGLYDAWARFEEDRSLRVAILTGAGDRMFCGGADLLEMTDHALGEPPADWAPVLGENVEVSKPTIAAVNGGAFGGGFLQAQMCDLALASRSARFAISEARWGRGSPWALPLFGAIPTRAVMDLLLTARPMSAARAYEVGLVNQIVEPVELMPIAMALARVIAANAPLSLAAAKQMSRIARSERDVQIARERTRQAYAAVYNSRDAQIGPQAFRDRVAPSWTGA